jgi:hypothetical protein
VAAAAAAADALKKEEGGDGTTTAATAATAAAVEEGKGAEGEPNSAKGCASLCANRPYMGVLGVTVLG